jgi:hypothetical protein
MLSNGVGKRKWGMDEKRNFCMHDNLVDLSIPLARFLWQVASVFFEVFMYRKG